MAENETMRFFIGDQSEKSVEFIFQKIYRIVSWNLVDFKRKTISNSLKYFGANRR